MDKIIELLIIMTLALTATYLVYKVPDVIVNGFEHNNVIYVQMPDFDYYAVNDDGEKS